MGKLFVIQLNYAKSTFSSNLFPFRGRKKYKMVVDSPVKVPVSNSRLNHTDDAANGNEDDGDSSGGEEIENVHR